MSSEQIWSSVAIMGPAEVPAWAWMCTKCHFVLGGAGLDEAPARCPMCAVAAGEVVAVVPSGKTRPKMLVLDRRILELVEAYRSAKAGARGQDRTHDEVESRGNYDLDGSGVTADETEISSKEHRSALALADATLERTSERTSRSSIH
ncbi:MAG: hypothetical protein ACXWUG_18580 [Polyangiales bacterium]